jgi:hypothetical protein
MRLPFFTFLLTITISHSSALHAKELTIGFGQYKHPYVMLDEFIEGDEGHKDHTGIEYSIIKQAVILMNHTLKAKSIPPRELKRAIKNFSRVDAVSGVKKSNDKYFYSDPILEIENFAVSKIKHDIHLSSISNLSPFNISSRTGAYAYLGKGFRKLYHPNTGSHRSRYKQFDNDIKQHMNFWEPGSEVVMITDKESFEHHKRLLSEAYDTTEDATFAPIFSTNSRFYVAFKSRKLRNEFNEALSTLKFEGTYNRVLKHYSYTSSISKHHKPNFNKIDQILLRD